MWRTSMFRKLVAVIVFLALAVSQVVPALAQSEDGLVPDGGSPAPAAAEDTRAEADKGEFTPGESSSVDAGNTYLYLPFAAGDADLTAAAPSATWVNVLYDEFCSYPTGWTRYDYNGTGHAWVKATVDGRCVARPNAVAHKMNVTTWRTVSVAGGVSPRALFRFKMNTERFWDYFRVEYSCNGGQHFWGAPSAYSGAFGWVVGTASLSNCAGSTNLRVRLTFQTDKIGLSAQAPTVDYFKVQHWK